MKTNIYGKEFTYTSESDLQKQLFEYRKDLQSNYDKILGTKTTKPEVEVVEVVTEVPTEVMNTSVEAVVEPSEEVVEPTVVGTETTEDGSDTSVVEVVEDEVTKEVPLVTETTDSVTEVVVEDKPTEVVATTPIKRTRKTK